MKVNLSDMEVGLCCICISLGAKEDARGNPVHRESMYDVYGEWNS